MAMPFIVCAITLICIVASKPLPLQPQDHVPRTEHAKIEIEPPRRQNVSQAIPFLIQAQATTTAFAWTCLVGRGGTPTGSVFRLTLAECKEKFTTTKTNNDWVKGAGYRSFMYYAGSKHCQQVASFGVAADNAKNNYDTDNNKDWISCYSKYVEEPACSCDDRGVKYTSEGKTWCYTKTTPCLFSSNQDYWGVFYRSKVTYPWFYCSEEAECYEYVLGSNCRSDGRWLGSFPNSIYRYTCAYYEKKGWCANGGKGPNFGAKWTWDTEPKDAKGRTAKDACCVCGKKAGTEMEGQGCASPDDCLPFGRHDQGYGARRFHQCFSRGWPYHGDVCDEGHP